MEGLRQTVERFYAKQTLKGVFVETRMKRALLFASALLACGTGVRADDIADCAQTRNADLKIRGCSELIDSKLLTKLGQAQAYNNRGIGYKSKGKYKLAIADYNMAIKLAPKFATAYGNRGNLYLKLGNFARAISDDTMAIKLAPDNAANYNNRAAAYYKVGDKEKAIADLRKALEIDPSLQSARNNLKKLGAVP